jgi:hypothetical protein
VVVCINHWRWCMVTSGVTRMVRKVVMVINHWRWCIVMSGVTRAGEQG